MPTKEEIIKLIEKNKCGYTRIIRARNSSFYDYIDTSFVGKKFGEKLYRWLHEDDKNMGKCPSCGKSTSFDDIFYGFRKYCSLKCSNNDNQVKELKKQAYLEQYGVENPSQANEIKEKKKETFLERFGVECNLTLTETKEQIKQTNLEKYGVEYPIQNKEVQEKAKRTNLERYGTECVGQVEVFKEKSKETCLKKYGVDHPLKSEKIHKKLEETNLERYGVRHAAQSPKIKQKTIDYFQSEFGCDNPFQNEHVKEKTKKTWLEKYGVDHPLKNAKIQNDIKQERRMTFFKSLFTSDRLKGRVIPLFTVEEYDDIKSKYLFKCCICNNKFEDTLDNGRIPRCLVCYPKLLSEPENDLLQYIKSLDTNLVIDTNNRKLLSNGKELDIYIPSKNIAIEFNGLFWHSELGGNKDQTYHLNKTVECNNVGMYLVHIFDDEWVNQSDIVKSRLKHILGYDQEHKIYARSCEIKEITSEMASDFLDKYHLQGKDNAPIRIGLFHDHTLVSVMTFGNLRKALGKESKEGDYEMYRFCSSFNVVGAAGKLLKYFINAYNPITIISYADRRWSSGTLYLKLGFRFDSFSSPGYFYTKDYLQRFHRFNYRKDQLEKKLECFDPALTEWENMQLNGYDRIWDCGQSKYEWKSPNIYPEGHPPQSIL